MMVWDDDLSIFPHLVFFDLLTSICLIFGPPQSRDFTSAPVTSCRRAVSLFASADPPS